MIIRIIKIKVFFFYSSRSDVYFFFNFEREVAVGPAGW